MVFNNSTESTAEGFAPSPAGQSPEQGRKDTAPANQFTAADVTAILHERGWLPDVAPSQELEAWLADAAALLGPHATDRDALARLLNLIFAYNAQAILQALESHIVLAREGAREVIRELAHAVLDGPGIDSDRFKEIVTALKDRLAFRGRELFHPIRLALAGRAGEGELDRVILLLDRAARLPFAAPVKGTRQRMLEFCAALE
ncbi:MAG: hypothetical protein HY237_08940 [Acidobacteria bacterium]|nr:hypothetical protein [Acidobacteriota bacterium]